MYRRQISSLVSAQKVSDYIDDMALHTVVMPKIRLVLEKHQKDVKIVNLVLAFYEKIVQRPERTNIPEQVILTLLSMSFSDPAIINRTVSKYS